MPKITNFDYSILLKKEQEMRELLGLKNKTILRITPKKSTVSAILNYSKALSVRPSKNLEYFTVVLN